MQTTLGLYPTQDCEGVRPLSLMCVTGGLQTSLVPLRRPSNIAGYASVLRRVSSAVAELLPGCWTVPEVPVR